MVTFVDWDGSFIKNETVSYGGNATAPADPSRAGYRFTGWDTDFTNVTSNLTVKALYTRVESSSSSSGGFSTATPKPTVPPKSSPPSETPPPVTPTPPVDDPLSAWAVVNLALGVMGIVLAAIITIYVLLLGQHKQRKPATAHKNADNYEVSKNDSKLKMLIQNRSLWLLTTLALGIAGIIIFILTEDTTLPMGIVDKWTIVNAIIFAIETITLPLTLKHKNTNNQI